MSFMPENINFADFLADDNAISNSPPISLPSQNSEKEIQNVFTDTNSSRIRPPKHTGQQGEFRSIEEIDSKYRHIFTYPYFNLVQSRVIEDALYSDKSMVVCAPTGSGKTVVFEMAIVQLLMDLEDKNYTEDFKIIYMAPVKALCTERLTEWYPKFTKLGLLCIEVTGDTDVDFPQLKPYRVYHRNVSLIDSIIITTPEKWDMLTRRWKDYKGLVEVVKLFLIDEVHILNDEVRGPVLEAVVSRMKTIEASVQSAHRIEQLHKQYKSKEPTQNITTAGPRIRFVAVSATVNNPEDVATWLGTSEKPAVYYKFGDECRPVKLKRVVEGYPCPEGTSIFKFDIILNYKLWPIIQKYHNGKPTLIFCNTRKSVALTAEALSREITITFNPEQKAKLTALASTLKNKKLQALILNGVGCHHAGLLFEERMNIEFAFRNRDLPILITTTTLAMGVNLPAHLVIIKNTQQYVNGAYQEYSISTILQMVGRAGRPQFDTEATAVIMTRMGDKARYQALVGGTEPLQSFLHKRLAENLNSEAALGTVTDVAQCVQWVNSTFLSVRAAKDPKRYLGLSPAAPANQISKKIEELCVIAMNGLASSGLITMDEASCIESTEAGKLMSVYYIDLETMKLIMKVEGSESLERLLWLICECHELSDMHLRQDERRCLNALNRNSTAATIRFPMKGKISSRQMKLNCVIQAVLGCLPIPEPSLNQEAMKIMRIADRVCKCLVAYTTRQMSVRQQTKNFSSVLNSIILAKCIAAHLWENSPYVSKQLKGIGPTFSALLASAGKVNFMLLEESHPRDLERIMNKGPPVGNVIRKQISLLPKYQLTLSPIDKGRVQIQLVLLNQAYLIENMEHLTAGANHKSYIVVGDSENYLLYLNSFKDSDLIRVYDGCITCEVTRKHNHEHKIMAYCISSNFVGIDVQSEYLFMNIESIYHKNFDYNTMNLCQGVSRPEPIVDLTQKRALIERKRKTDKSVDVTCSKEKIKRENNLLEKLKYLKESFGKTSKEIMGNFNKTSESSNKVLKTLRSESESFDINDNNNDNVSPEKVVAIDFTEQNRKANPKIFEDIPTKQITSHTDEIFEHSEDEDQINNILQEIESEIGKKIEPNISRNVQPNNIFTNNKSKTLIQNRQFKARMPLRKFGKSNFNFINKLEENNKFDKGNQDTVEFDDNEGGFANTVKFHLDSFLQNVNNARTNDVDIKDILNMERKDTIDDNLATNVSGCYLSQKSFNTFKTVGNSIKDSSEKTTAPEKSVLIPNDSEILDESKQVNIEVPGENINDKNLNNYVGSLHKNDFFPNPHNNSQSIVPVSIYLVNPDSGKDMNNQIMQFANDNSTNKDRNIIDDIKNVKGDANLIQTKIESVDFVSMPPSLLMSVHTEGLRTTEPTIEVIDQTDSVESDPRENMKRMSVATNHEETALPKYTGYHQTKNRANILNEKQSEQSERQIENYSFRAAQLSICKKRNSVQTIQIIQKLKIDLDVTKIISTNISKPNNDKKDDNDEHDIINVEPEPSNYWTINCQSNCNQEQSINILSHTELEHNKDKKSNVFKFLTPPALSNAQESNFYNQNNDKCTNVKDIITKYSAKLKSSRKTIAPFPSVTKQVPITNHIKPPMNKPKRRYKISDIQNIEIDWPKISLADDHKVNLNSQVTKTGQSEVCRDDNISHDVLPVISNISECHMNETVPLLVEISDELNGDMNSNIGNLSPECQISLNSELPVETYDINSALLNPKTLLQRYDMQNTYDSLEVIPPPPEYADVLTTSPNQMVASNAYTPCSPIIHYPESNYYTSIYDDQDDLARQCERNSFSQNTSITPSEEIDTWTLSREDNPHEYDLMQNPKNRFTMMRNNSPATVMRNCSSDRSLSSNNSRNVKLQEFKFIRKNLLKIKK